MGLIGLGAVGRQLGAAIAKGEIERCQLVAVLVRQPERHGPETRRQLGCRITNDPAEFLGADTDLVVECAGHEALKAHGEAVLRGGKDLLAISVGAFADRVFQERIERAAHESGRRLYLATGAIAGLDAIAAASVGGLESVIHSVRKPPRGLLSPREAAEVERLGQPLELYCGPAREAAIRFPENVNVAAAVSLAGLGLDRTTVRVVADPTVVRNTHEIEARGHFGELRVILQNIPSENPKTGRLTAMSMVKALRNLTAPVVVGI